MLDRSLGRLRPRRRSSRMRSLTSTLASTAVPMVSTKPAMPGSVSVAFRIAMTPRITNTFRTTAMFA
jgi:hypothetical protein